MLVVVALGGNALLRRGEPQDARRLAANVEQAAHTLAGIANEHRVVITHGNGPQIGLLALQSEAYRDVPPFPLDILGAESEGLIGYLLERELSNALPDRQFATLLTQVRVDPSDPAFDRPTKPIGPGYDSPTAARLATERHWTFAVDGDRSRRTVPSPKPQEIVEVDAIRMLLDGGVIVICLGGGGIPVRLGTGGRLQGVEAVIDKDLASGLLAAELDADVLLMLTDVEAVWNDWPPDKGQPIPKATPDEIDAYRFAAGSMGPKVRAASDFVRDTGHRAAIGALADAPRILAGRAGTWIAPD